MFQARFNQEFRKLYSCLPCIEQNSFENELTDVRLSNQPVLRRLTNQQQTPNSSSQYQQRSRQNTTTSVNSIPLNNQSSISIKTSQHDGKEQQQQSCSINRHQNRFLGHPKTNTFHSSKTYRTIDNCEKFLADQELNNSSKENDLLLIHPNSSNDF